MISYLKRPASTPLNKAIIAILLLTVNYGLSGCSKSIKPEVHEPTKLIKLSQDLNLLTPVFSQDIGGKLDKYTSAKLQVGYGDDKLIVASPKGKVTSYNLQGEKQWSITLDQAIVGGVSFDKESNTAIVSTRNADIIGLDTNTGTQRWKQKITGTVLVPALIHNNRVIVPSIEGVLHGLSLQTGEPIWQFATQAATISVRGAAQPVLINDNTVLYATANGRLHAIDIETGIPVWSRRVGIPQGSSEIERMTDIDATPVVDNGQLFAVTYSGQLVEIDIATRKIIFLKEVSSLNDLAVTPNLVIVTTLEGYVNAYDRENGELIWSNTDLAYRNLTNPVVLDDYIAVGDMDGVIHLLDTSNGQIVSRSKTKGALHTLRVTSQTLITLSNDGIVTFWKLN